MSEAKAQYELNWNSREDRDVLEVIQAFKDLRRKKAELEFQKIARQGQDRVFMQTPDGVGGELAMQIHPESYHYWGQRLGYQCWSDPTFCKEYLRDNPYARVKSRARNLSLTVPGLKPATKRFSKTYPAAAGTN